MDISAELERLEAEAAAEAARERDAIQAEHEAPTARAARPRERGEQEAAQGAAHDTVAPPSLRSDGAGRTSEPPPAAVKPEPRPAPGGDRGGGDGYDGGSLDDAVAAGGEGPGGEGAALRPLPVSPWQVHARALVESGVYPSGDGWSSELQRNGDGAVMKRARNVIAVLRNAPEFRGRLRFNEMTLSPEWCGRRVSDSDVTHVRALLERDWCAAGKDLAQEALRVAAEFSPYDPRREYLAGLRWDGEARIGRVARELLGSEHPLYPAFLRCFFLSAVRRVFEPGCKVDTVLVLLGSQGFFKSTFFRVLFGEWFSDSSVEPGTREGMLAANSAWGLEIPEVEHLTLSREDSTLKRFITSAVDTFRRPYAAAPEPIARSSVFCATTNERAFLRDRTGTGFRRWHVVEVLRRIDAAELAAWRDHLWAEAVRLYRLGVPHWLTADEESDREGLTSGYVEGEPWDALVEAYVTRAENLRAVTVDGAACWAVASNDLLRGACSLDARELTSTNQRRMAAVMVRLGASRSRQRFTRGVGADRRLGPPEHCYLLPEGWDAGGLKACDALRREAREAEEMP